MKLSRRRFIGGALAAFAALHGFMPRQGLSAERRQAKLRILILGGTGFLGPHTVRAALARGHELTLFNRGKTNPGLFADVESLRGDRDGDLEALAGRNWDAVIDNSGYVPRIVGDSARLLAGAVRQYVFISSVSAYADFSTPGADETAPLGRLERAAEAEMPGRVTVIRPGLIVGPGDPTDRFTYWPVRVARGGEVLAPGDPATPVQLIDVRDLGAWIVHCVEARVLGVYNALSPAGAWSTGDLLEACRDAAGSDARFTWVDAAFLEAQGVAAWSDLPVWLPAEGDYAGSGRTSAAKAVAAGLGFRPLRTTAADTLAWWQDERARADPKLRAGLDPGRERAVLEAWHESRQPG